ncbi:MAG: hypothetical protein JXR25_08710 [Pontiellaceae bacterium]|nr:hypothetical protein [Pontiellaceae bacterium]MBN2784895.1 hypothetical protein [Pontiellaceae bacterium]
MQARILLISSTVFCSVAAMAGPDLDMVMEKAALQEAVRNRTDGALLDESIAVEQARIEARSGAGFGMELRPSVSDDSAGMALRFTFPDRWSRKKLEEQIQLSAESEQLRTKALEWQEIISVYRSFCRYRMLEQKSVLITAEVEFIKPLLKQADEGVVLNQFSVTDRARLYGSYLSYLNEQNKISSDRIEVMNSLRTVLGAEIDLPLLAKISRIEMPSQMELSSLLRTALEQRADYKNMDLQYQALQLAESDAQSKEGFHLKFIQPEYRMNHDNGSDGWELSAAFVLPWGTRNPDVAIYNHQKALTQAMKDQQRSLIEHRLQVLIATASAYYEHSTEQNRSTAPVIKRLKADLETLKDLPLEQSRDLISIRERILDAELQLTELTCRMETVAVDLADELGGW